MSLLLRPSDPRPNKQEQKLSEQVEMILSMDAPYTDHEDAINAFLVALRDDTNHTVVIRSVETQLESTKNPDKITALTTIHYLLIGTTDAPYIP